MSYLKFELYFKKNKKTILFFLLLLSSFFTVSSVSANAGSLMQNVKKQMQYQNQYKAPQEKIKIIQSKREKESQDQNNTAREKFLEEKTSDEEDAYKASDSYFKYNQNSSAVVRLKKARVYSFPSDNGLALGDKYKGEVFAIDGCNVYEWCKVKGEKKYLKKFRLTVKAKKKEVEFSPFVALKEKEKIQQKQVTKSVLRKEPTVSRKAHVEKPSPKVVVKKFNITGNTLISSAEIESYLQIFQNKQLTFKELQDVVRDISNYYRRKGYTARTLLPPQEIRNGVVKIVVLEGNLSAIEIDADDLKRISSKRAKHIIENAHPVGEKLKTKDLERGLLILNDTPGIVSSATLVAGEKAGDSKLKVKVEDGSLYDVFVNYANSGARSTGVHQMTISANINSPFAMGEQITLQGMMSKGNKYVGGGFSLPVSNNGIKIGVDASTMTYDVINGADADGTAHTVGIWASYPLIRSQKTNLNVSLNYDEKYYLNRSSGFTINDKTNKGLSVTLSGNHYDDYGQTSVRATLSNAKLDLSAVESSYLADQATVKADGSYSKFYLNLYRTQLLTDTLYLSFLGTFQKASKNLDSGEKFYLGGSTGVRAYPVNEAAGDEGYLLNMEIVKSFTYAFSAGLFYDLGQIKQHKNEYIGWQGLSNVSNKYKLKGAGLNLNYYYETWSAKATYALKHGDNPNPQADGTDNDGTDRNYQVWLQLMKMF